MSLTTPTTKDISDNIITQMEASINQTIPPLQKSFLRVMAKALAAIFIIAYKYAGFIFKQMFVSTASFAETEINGDLVTPLVELGRLVGVTDPVAATQAELLIEITVENQVGTLPSGSQLLGATNGVTYTTTAAVALAAATVQVNTIAVADQADGNGAGVIGNLDAGAIMSFANPVPNVARDTEVVSQTVTGADAETEAAYRQRVLNRYQNQPQGGAYTDYRDWALEVAGIINVYPYTGDPGEVDVYSEAAETPLTPDGVPTAAQLIAVKASIEADDAGLASRRPANAYVNSLAISRRSFSVTVNGITQVDDLAAVQTSVEDALDEYFVKREPYITGLSTTPRTDTISQSEVTGIVSEVVGAAGGIFTSAAVFEGVSTVVTAYLGEGEKAKLTSVTFT